MLDGQPDVGGTMSTAALIGDVTAAEIRRSERLATLADIDMYGFSVAKGDVVRIETRLPAGGTAADTYLRIFDATGGQILVDDDGNVDSPGYSRITAFVAPARGRYFVGVSSSGNAAYKAADGTGAKDGLATGDYTLAIVRTGQRTGETGTNEGTTGIKTKKQDFDQFGPIFISILQLTYTYASPVNVVGNPEWQLVIGSDAVSARYVSTSDDKRTLTFEYEIANGIEGAVTAASQLSLPTGAAITDDASNAPATLQVATKPSVPDVVDTTAPRAALVTYPDAGIYKKGDRLDFTVEFDEAVSVTGKPQLQLTVGSRQTTAEFQFVTGRKKRNKAVFTYIADTTDSDGIELEQGPIHSRSQTPADSAIRLGTAKIKDRAGNISDLFPYQEASDFPADVPRVAIQSALSRLVRIDADPAAPVTPAEQGTAKLADGRLNAVEASTETVFRVGLGTSGALAGDTVELLLGGDAFSPRKAATLQAADVTNGFVDFRLTGADVGGDGVKSLSARVTDAAGNVGKTSPSLTFTKDASPPGRPATPAEQGTAKLADGRLNAVEASTGTVFRVRLGTSGALAGDTVELLLGGAAFSPRKAATLQAADVTNGFVDFRLTGADVGGDGGKSLSARVTDAAGNAGLAGLALAFTKDTSPPGRPATPAEQGTAKLADGRLNAVEASTETVFRVRLGTSGALAGDTVELLLGGAAFSPRKAATLRAADVTNGFVDFRLTGADVGGDGMTSLSARVTDAAGNAGLVGLALAFTKDTSPPGRPATPAEQGTAKLADGRLNAVEAPTETVFRVRLGTSGALAGDTVELLLGGPAFSPRKAATLRAADVTNGFVDFRLTGADLGGDGMKLLSARVTDAAGNAGPAGLALAFTKDTSPPGRPAIPAEQGTAKLADGRLNAVEASTETVFRVRLGTSGALAGDTVELLLGGAAFSPRKAATLRAADITNGFVDFRLTGADLGGDGMKLLSARVTDAAGNAGLAGPALAFMKDTRRFLQGAGGGLQFSQPVIRTFRDAAVNSVRNRFLQNG